MAASRASSMRALNQLAVGNKQVRKLHMTGPATFPSPLLTSERPAFSFPRDLAGLRAECQKRKLPTAGNKAELTDRLSADELVHTRSFSTAISSESKRPTTTTETSTSTQPTRHFNTSRALKSVNDYSTIDFAYFPDFDPNSRTAHIQPIRVPLLPQSYTTATYADDAPASSDAVMRPTIMTAAADSTHISAMSEVTDTAVIDFQGMAAKVSKAWQKATPTGEGDGMVKQVWSGLMDDLFGPKNAKA